MVESTVKSSITPVVELTQKAPIHVLHVDDEAGFLNAAQQCLKMQGNFEVETATSVKEAKEKMKGKAFDVIVSDYKMPGKDGLEFLKELRDNGNSIPFIMFTGKGREEVAVQALNLGADQYLNKIGSPETVYSELAHSITKLVEIKRAEEKVRESEEKYRSLFENAKDVIVLMDLKGNVNAMNKAAAEYGFKKEEVVGKNMLKFVPKRHWPKLLKELVQLARGKIVESKIEIVTPKGKKNAEYISNPITINNKIVGVQTILRDITEHKAAEEEKNKLLHDYNERVKEIRCLSEITKLVEKPNISLEEILREANDLLPGAWQYPEVACSRIVFKNLEFKTENFKETRWKQQSNIKVHGKKVGVVEVYYLEEKPTMAEGPFLKEERDLINAVAGRLGKVIERKKAEEALWESEEKFRNIFDSASDCLIYLDRSGRILDVNRKAVQVFGGSKNELLGKHFARLGIFSLTETPTLMKNFADILAGKKAAINIHVKNKKGQEISLECSASLMKTGAEFTGIMVVARDVTERKKAENALKESQAKFERLFMNNPEAAVYADSDFHILGINPRFSKLFGYSLGEVKGKHINDVTVPEDKMDEAEILDKKARKGYVYHDAIRKRKDGSLVYVSISIAPIIVEGQLKGFVGLYKDITERKEAEEALRTMLEKLQMLNEKLGVVGRLTRHDARNKLSAVRMNAFLARQKLAGDPEALECLSQIELACGEVERIFDFARTYEKLGMEELTYIDVEKSLGEAVMSFSDMHGARVVNDCRGLTVLADSLLRQLFYNLIDNSLRHGENVSKIRAYYEETRNDKLKLVYEDNGVGIPEAEKEKIFKEGYGKGTGYGLYLIRKMCEVYGWIIQETGKHGKGAQFTITIPETGKNGKTSYQLSRNK